MSQLVPENKVRAIRELGAEIMIKGRSQDEAQHHDNRYTFPIVQDLVDDIVLVNEEQILSGMLHLYRNEQLVVEGAAAIGVAALLHQRVAGPGHNIAVIVSGRNVDMNVFTQIATGQFQPKRQD